MVAIIIEIEQNENKLANYIYRYKTLIEQSGPYKSVLAKKTNYTRTPDRETSRSMHCFLDLYNSCP